MDAEKLWTQEEVAQCFGVGVRTVRDWRLVEHKATKDKPEGYYLPAVKDPNHHQRLLYRTQDILDFAEKHPRYLFRAVSFLEDETTQSNFPRALATEAIAALRGQQQTQPEPIALGALA